MNELNRPDKSPTRSFSLKVFLWGLFCLFLLFVLAGYYLIDDDRLVPADVIAVLSGNDDIRLSHTADLYHEGLASSIILTNTGRTYGEYDWPYNQYQIEQLRQLDVPEGAIHTVDLIAKNTGQEATSIIEQMVAMRAASVIIVTDAWHTRRTRIIYSDTFANTGFRVQYHAAGEGLDPYLWWLTPNGWKIVGGEYLRIIGYIIKRDSNIPDYPIFDFLKKLVKLI